MIVGHGDYMTDQHTNLYEVLFKILWLGVGASLYTIAYGTITAINLRNLKGHDNKLTSQIKTFDNFLK